MSKYFLRTHAGTVYAFTGIEHSWSLGGTSPSTAEQTAERLGYGTASTLVVTIAGPPVDEILFEQPRQGPVLDYELTDLDLVSVRYPAQLTVDQWNALDADEDENRYKYRARRAEAAPVLHRIDVTGYQPWPLELDEVTERPRAPIGATWSPASAWAQLFGLPSHDHLVPGFLTGFHQAAAAMLQNHPNIDRGWLSEPRVEKRARGAVVKASYVFAHEDGLSHQVKAGRRKTARPARETVRVEIELGIDAVGGPTMLDAITAWKERMAAVAAQVPEPGVVCSRCRGAGFLRPKQAGS